MTLPRVSVLVLAHDAHDTAGVAATLNSLLEQHGVAVEPVILAGPSSDSDLLGNLRRTTHTHPAPLFVSLAEREPLGTAMARGSERATGNWISWLHAGDVLEPGVLSRLLEGMAARPAKAMGLCGQPGIAEIDGLTLVGRMAGKRAAAVGLLAPRELIRAVGGFDRARHLLAPLDMIARLAGRFPLLLIPAAKLHPQQADSSANQNMEDQSERAGIAIRLLSDLLGGKSPSPPPRRLTLEAYRHLYGGADLEFLAILGRSLARTIRPDDLTVVALGTRRLSASGLGVAGARMIRVPQPVDTAEELLEQLVGQSSTHVVAIDSTRPPTAPTLAVQLLHQIACESTACFPPEELWGQHRPGSLLPGTVLRSSGLTTALMQDLHRGEGPFWYALQRHGALETCPTIPIEPSLEHGGKGWLQSSGANLQAAELVDKAWYSQRYPDRQQPDLDPANHYLAIGWKDGFDPNPWFQTTWYARISGIQEADTRQDKCPLLHFVEVGAAEGLLPHPRLNLTWYALRYLGSPPSVAAFRYFLDVGLSAGHVPEQIMDDFATLRAIQSLPPSERTPAVFTRLQEDRLRLVTETIADLVDREWYRHRYPDVADSGVDPAWHYVTYGWREGRVPSDWFSPAWYKTIAMPGMEGISPLEHFVSYGAAGGYRPVPEFDTVWYARHYLGTSLPTAEALRHFLTAGLEGGAVPDPILQGPGLRAALLRIPPQDRSALIKRLWSLRHASCGNSLFQQGADTGDWALLLHQRKPPGTETVFLVLNPHAAGLVQKAELAGNMLPSHETPLFILAHGIDRIEIRDRMETDAVSVSATPAEVRPLLRKLRATRAIAVDPNLAASPVGAALVNAGLSFTANRNGR